MFRLFNWCKSLFHGEERQIYGEDELKTLAKNHRYFRNKRVSDIASLIVIVVLILFAVALVVQYVTDVSFRSFVVQQVENNFSALIVAVLFIAGIRYSSKGNDDDQ